MIKFRRNHKRPVQMKMLLSILDAKDRALDNATTDKCDRCRALQFGHCFGPCSLRDISRIMREARERDREITS